MLPARSKRNPDAGLEYARRVYDRVIDWYKVAEAKAQFLLTVNGVLATVALGVGSGLGIRLRDLLGPEAWIFLGIAIAGIAAAVVFAAACLLSRHQHNIRVDLANLGVDPNVPETYRPEALWYFGHLATLQTGPAVARLRSAGRKFEIDALTYNVIGLSKVVLRKHRFINAAWNSMTVAILSIIVVGVSLLIRSA
jgi:hypothetical protein